MKIRIYKKLEIISYIYCSDRPEGDVLLNTYVIDSPGTLICRITLCWDTCAKESAFQMIIKPP